MAKKLYVTVGTSLIIPVNFNAEICNGCNKCIEVCQVDLFIPNPDKGKPPIVLFPMMAITSNSPKKILWVTLPTTNTTPALTS